MLSSLLPNGWAAVLLLPGGRTLRRRKPVKATAGRSHAHVTKMAQAMPRRIAQADQGACARLKDLPRRLAPRLQPRHDGGGNALAGLAADIETNMSGIHFQGLVVLADGASAKRNAGARR